MNFKTKMVLVAGLVLAAVVVSPLKTNLGGMVGVILTGVGPGFA